MEGAAWRHSQTGAVRSFSVTVLIRIAVRRPVAAASSFYRANSDVPHEHVLQPVSCFGRTTANTLCTGTCGSPARNGYSYEFLRRYEMVSISNNRKS